MAEEKATVTPIKKAEPSNRSEQLIELSKGVAAYRWATIEAAQILRCISIATDHGESVSEELQPEIGIARNLARTTSIADAWVICCSDAYRPDLAERFGRFCVRIDRPHRFFENVTSNLDNTRLLECAQIGRVRYASRTYRDHDPVPHTLGFVKIDREDEREIRMLWTPRTHELLNPFGLSCPLVKRLCTLVD